MRKSLREKGWNDWAGKHLWQWQEKLPCNWLITCCQAASHPPIYSSLHVLVSRTASLQLIAGICDINDCFKLVMLLLTLINCCFASCRQLLSWETEWYIMGSMTRVTRLPGVQVKLVTLALKTLYTYGLTISYRCSSQTTVSWSCPTHSSMARRGRRSFALAILRVSVSK